ncbi:NADH-quinone oxidoreductase subunit NuoG [Shewanella sp. D64]|uniref:NADH-quinone oxidoreductase subunit NuoG n=1 Tax=unclassified Shewanella TaxID=196818 RepID=UPI0022BA6345|nr:MULTISPECIES: NADH-quinone oxidoreductase subunit NuoG [unclassified Shewanella]MEC4724774.1 NADH-quinone oxidoreductase subunit NuoG [Shewanella sp. D64]MEC4736432.1 NADH-quinone oxidoreductase subunit NuoG [Shewanella sp. E94]WBJ97510.1 NADH-quinone oxidoreductase subunit NuoG [Shewanella sp. MTB7]
MSKSDTNSTNVESVATISLTIDNQVYGVEKGQNLLQACLSLGLDLPYFCWHPSMGSVGSCRQCAVTQYQNSEDTRGRLVMSCMATVSEGMIISLQDDKSQQFRKTNIAAIMTNHPHDCPVCEEGGNCHLQDMTLMSKHITRRYPGKKRTHLNQFLGPLLNHEMNRCIGCYRCVRFYRDYCGGNDLNVFGSKSHLYFGRAESGILESPFSGNLAEVCPTGVFTDKPFSHHYSRKWDLQTAPVVCPHCSLGCNLTLGERSESIRRVTNRHHDAINGHFLCNTGLFGYEHVNHNERLEWPLKRNNEHKSTDVLTQEQTQALLAEYCHNPKENCIAVGSVRTHIENNGALLKLVGETQFYLGINDSHAQLLDLLCKTYSETSLTPMSLTEIETCDATLIINEDITHTAPRLALSVRQMSRNAGLKKAANLGVQHWQDGAVRNIAQTTLSPLHIIESQACELTPIATQSIILHPAEQIRLLEEVAFLLDDRLFNTSQDQNRSEMSASNEARNIVDDLLSAQRPLVLTGIQSRDIHLLSLSIKIANSLKQLNQNAGFYAATQAGNDLHLGLLSSNNSSNDSSDNSYDDTNGRGPQGLDSLIKRLNSAPVETLIVLETDLYRYLDNTQLDNALNNVKQIIVIDQLLTKTASMADLILPATSFAESYGCDLSSEGRLQFSFATMPQIKGRLSPWQWLSTLVGLPSYGELVRWIAAKSAPLKVIEAFAELTRFNELSPFKIARQTVRDSGRTAIHAVDDVKESQPIIDLLAPINNSMEGVAGFRQTLVQPISVLPANQWSPKWNSDQGGGHGREQGYEEANSLLSIWNKGIKIFSTATPLEIADPSSQSTNSLSSLKESENARLGPMANLYADFELAQYSAALVSLAPKKQANIHPDTAAKWQLAEGDIISLFKESTQIGLECIFNSSQAKELILIPTEYFTRLGDSAKWTRLSTPELTSELKQELAPASPLDSLQELSQEPLQRPSHEEET